MLVTERKQHSSGPERRRVPESNPGFRPEWPPACQSFSSKLCVFDSSLTTAVSPEVLGLAYLAGTADFALARALARACWSIMLSLYGILFFSANFLACSTTPLISTSSASMTTL